MMVVEQVCKHYGLLSSDLCKQRFLSLTTKNPDKVKKVRVFCFLEKDLLSLLFIDIFETDRRCQLGGMVYTADLKSAELKRSYGFDSHSWYNAL